MSMRRFTGSVVMAATVVTLIVGMTSTSTIARAATRVTRCATYHTNVLGDPWTFTHVTVRGLSCGSADKLLRQLAKNGVFPGYLCRGTHLETCSGEDGRRLTYEVVPNT